MQQNKIDQFSLNDSELDQTPIQVRDPEVEQFSVAYDVDYYPSELILVSQFTFCEVCTSENPGVHKPSCLTQVTKKPTPYSELAKEFITVNVYKHSLPSLNGCQLADNQCAGC